ncbi:sensor histidine kinase [Hufsiella ginkgonis]|uniref:Histidine kinase n=1 Tax=Hufsiella ginkgonis TaxID=2695274 RepID=A0A7K1Y0N3_9SPHI|nr:histidine kinase [Hufsiella ginkgonis]MXV16648.1 hypothetical protein [Hufsiella ginkgonis]
MKKPVHNCSSIIVWIACLSGTVLLFLSAVCPAQPAIAFEKPRLTVAGGLPQSYVSGLAQDRHGFIWIGTRDGLARYDGRRFKVFRNIPGNPASLSANVIVSFFLDQADQLWIHYQNGDIDILNTTTEHLVHFTKDPVYKQAFRSVKTTNGIIQTGPYVYWLLGDQGGIFVADLQQHRMRFYPDIVPGMRSNPITGMAASAGEVFLVTDTALIRITTERKVKQVIPYTFDEPHLYNNRRSWKDNAPVLRKNGDWIIIDESRLIIYQAAGRNFIVKPMPFMKLYLPSFHSFDEKGNLIFDFDGVIYILTPDNRLVLWKERGPFPREGIVSMLYDRSGVLWIGTNGYDLRQLDLRLPRMTLEQYKTSFPEDLLRIYLDVNTTALRNSPLSEVNPYLFRWVSDDHHGRIWMTRAGPDPTAVPNLCYYSNGQLVSDNWRYTDTPGKHTRINSLALSASGKLWGVDFFLRLLELDTLTRTATIRHRVKAQAMDKLRMVNSMVMDGEQVFWITTSLGLLRYDAAKQATREFNTILPASDLTTLANDPADPGILWIGSLGGGLIRLNKHTLKYHIYTTNDGLPNNTVYAIIPVDGNLWCSSNKGVFAFNPRNRQVQSYTSLDGLIIDEFNQFHYLKLPHGRLSFGGTKGYTVFDPRTLVYDTFNPEVALTGFKLNNKDADYGLPGSPLSESINGAGTLILSYQQNFLTFDFAALEYNMPEKLRYRYRMTGVDKQWVETASGIASYTDLAPGRYVFEINATNTTGSWSPYVKKLRVEITPPFWLTWWFLSIVAAMAIVVAYLAIRWRIEQIRRQEKQKHQFEREVIELETQALRAQMNPHFIFNCLNSIKALIQENQNPQAIHYLTVFSKLVRNKISNVQQEISLEEEIQTCKLYAQLESIRFGDKISFHFFIDSTIDANTIMVPPLLLQPLIENAIWHGVLPLQKPGEVTVRIEKRSGFLYCAVEDNGIGRKRSESNKSALTLPHQSQGLNLITNRLKLYNNTNEKDGIIEVIDKKDDSGMAAGTLIIIRLKL